MLLIQLTFEPSYSEYQVECGSHSASSLGIADFLIGPRVYKKYKFGTRLMHTIGDAGSDGLR